MPRIEARLAELRLSLPPAVKPPPGVVLPFRFVRVLGNRALVSGHSPQAADGSVAGPFGKVGRELTVEQGHAAARLTALSMLGSLQRELGDLDRVKHWVRLFGMVNSAPGFDRQPAVINGCSDLILNCGATMPARTRAARSAWPNCRSAFLWRSRRKWKFRRAGANPPSARAVGFVTLSFLHR